MGCSSETTPFPRKATCPANGRAYRQVGRRTVLHHVTAPWRQALPEQGYYFCTDPDCEVVYFGEDGATLTRAALRASVGQKSRAPDRTVCYCFGIDAAGIIAAQRPDGDNALRSFVVAQTRAGTCACGVRNPSGRCCLVDFPKT